MAFVLTLITVLVVLAAPLTAVAMLLVVAGHVQRRREARVIRQVAVTDAIHRELGAVAAPSVTHRLGRGWRIDMAVPVDRPALLGRMVSIAHAALLRADVSAGEGMTIVLRPRVESLQARVTRLDPFMAREGEVARWTGTSTSRAS